MSKGIDLGNGIRGHVDPKGSEGDRIKVSIMEARGLPLVRDANGYLDVSALSRANQ